MSQPSAANDNPPAMDQESFTQAQLNQLFESVGTDPSFYRQNNTGASNDLDFKFDVETYSTLPEFAALSPAPAPDFSNYNFGQHPNEYPAPGPNTPHPYPIEQQECLNSCLAVPLPFRPRPRVLRSQTNTSYLQPSHPPPQYTRRRSLSQGDAERIAAVNASPNPTFLRLQTPRAVNPDEHLHKRRSGPYKHGHSRNTSRGTNSGRSTRSNTPMDMPYNPNLLGGMIPTSIGTPLSPASPRYHRPVAGQQMPVRYEGPDQDVIFRQMMRPDQMEQSRKIIEIGAIAVRAPFDPRLQNNNESILKKLGEVEQYLKHGGGDCEDALKGCATIRQALTRKLSVMKYAGAAHTADADCAVNTTPDVPSTLLSTQGSDFFAGGADDESSLMAMLIQEGEDSQFSNSH